MVKQGIPEPGGHTAQHPNFQLRIFALDPGKKIEPKQYALFCIFSYGTGVYQHDTGIFPTVTRFVSIVRQDSGNYLGITHIHLAPISLYIKGNHGTNIAYSP